MGVFKVRVIGDSAMAGAFPDALGANVAHVLTRYLQPATANDKVEIRASGALNLADYTNAADINKKLSFIGSFAPVDVTIVIFGSYATIKDGTQAAAARDFLARAAPGILSSTPSRKIIGLVPDPQQTNLYPERMTRAQSIAQSMGVVFGQTADILQVPGGSPIAQVKALFPELVRTVASMSRGTAIFTSSPAKDAAGNTVSEACESGMNGLGEITSCALPPPQQLPDDFFVIQFPMVKIGETETVFDPAKTGGGKKGLSTGNMVLLGLAAVGAAVVLIRRRGSF
jgi:hypothetical protein